MTHRMLVGSLAALAFAPAVQAMELGSVDIHGFVSQGYLISNENDYISSESTSGTFEYNEAGINFGTDVTDDLRIGLQLFSRDLGDWSNNELIIDWAYGDYYITDEFSIRAGKIKTNKGLWRDIQDFDFLRVWTILPTSVYDPAERSFGSSLVGGEIYGTFDLNAAGSLSYHFSVGDVDISESQDVARLFEPDGIDQMDVADINVVVGAHFDYQSPVDGLRGVLTFSLIDEMDFELSGVAYDTVDLSGVGAGPFLPVASPYYVDFGFQRYDILTIGIEYLWEQWSFYGEYSRIFQEYTVTTTSALGTSSREEELDTDGFYVGFGYRHDDHWNFGGYFSGYWPDADDRSGDDRSNDYEAWRYDLALSLRYDINEFWLVKAEAHFVNGTAGLNQYNYQSDDELEEDWQYFALKTTFNF